MLKLPIYSRNGHYYFHIHINHHQVKRSLNTKDPAIAMIRALDLLKVIDMSIDLNKIKKYEIDLANGVFKSNGTPEDHQHMMEAVELIGSRLNPAKTSLIMQSQKHSLKGDLGLRLPALVDKFFNLKKQLREATLLQYKKVVNEFAGFAGN